MPYKPPYELNSGMVRKVAEITNLIGQIEGYQLLGTNVRLRRRNQIKSLRSSLAIEGNRLTEEQITAILEGKRVIGPRQDVLEVQNAIEVYKRIGQLNPNDEDHLLESHGTLMEGLIGDAGRYRQSGVGVLDREKVIHIAPPFNMVPKLMGDLFDYLVKYDEETIIKSCVFHYEFEFIHPFSDGNGRMGRLWQTIILKETYPVMAHVPFESIILERQQGYYDALQHSQSLGNSNPFIDYMLNALTESLQETLTVKSATQTSEDRLLAYRERIGEAEFSRKDYQLFHKNISTSTASRDLQRAVDDSELIKRGDKRNATYHFRS